MSVPNQLVITVRKEKTDKQHLYSCINLEAIDYAAIHLRTVGAFKLWMYIAKNQNEYEFELSRAAFCAWSGLSPSAYQDAIKLLKEQSFLIQSATQKNKLIFYEKPQAQTMPKNEGDFIIDVPVQKKEEIKKTKALFEFKY